MSVFLFLHLSSVSLSFMSLSNDVRCQIVVTRILVEFFSFLGLDCSKSRFAGSFFEKERKKRSAGKRKVTACTTEFPSYNSSSNLVF